jgi:hypothetical protein
LVAQLDRLVDNRTAGTVAITGRIMAVTPTADPDTDADAAQEPYPTPNVQSVDVRLAGTAPGAAPLASAPVLSNGEASSDATTSVFQLNVPLTQLPPGTSTLVLAAHSATWGSWSTILRVAVPVLGPDPAARPIATPAPVAVRAPVTLRAAEIQSPQPGDGVPRTFVLQVLAPRADHVDVFLDPGRDHGGKLIGSSADTSSSGEFRATITAPMGPQNLEVHARSTATGKEEVLTLPITVS